MTKNYLIIADKPGYLGNRILIHSHFISAKEYLDSTVVLNPTFDDYHLGFEISENDPLFRIPLNRQSVFLNLLKPHFARRILFLSLYAILRIGLYFKINNRLLGFYNFDFDQTLSLKSQKELKIFTRHKFTFLRIFWIESNIDNPENRDIIKSFFKPAKQYKEILPPVKNQIFIGVHIRQRDYSKLLNGKYHFELSVYETVCREAKQYYLSNNQNPVFIICSDDATKIMNSPFFKESCYKVESRDLLLDFHLLRSCELIIAPPSTFSLSAGILGNNKIFFIETENTSFNKNEVRPCVYKDFDYYMKEEFLKNYKRV